MKKIIIITLLGIVSISAFAQIKTEKTQRPTMTTSDSLTISKEHAIELYKLMEYCKEAISTTVSKKITVADASAIMAGIVELQKVIAEKYQPKQSAVPAVEMKPKP